MTEQGKSATAWMKALRVGLLAVAVAMAVAACGGGGAGTTATDTTTPCTSCASGDTGGSNGTGGSTGAGTGGGSGTAGTGGTTDATGGGTDAVADSNSAGGNGGGVGSGGTGLSADATGIGGISAFGSIIVNGIRHDIDQATITVNDATSLKLGMTVQVNGVINPTTAQGTARTVVSAAELRGAVESVDAAGGSLRVLGTVVTIDNDTVFDGLTGLADLAPRDTVQVYGLPTAPGSLRATRIERSATTASGWVLTGFVQALDRTARSFRLGDVTVRYASAAFASPLTEALLADGLIVRVRTQNEPAALNLVASRIESWYALPTTTGQTANLSGVVTGFTGLGAFQLLGQAVDASAAQITGGNASFIGNGTRLDVTGTVQSGVIKATTVRIRYTPGTGGPVALDVSGKIARFDSVASFMVNGTTIDASGAGVTFVNGTAANLAKGVSVSVSGTDSSGGVLLASRVTFD